MLATWVTINRMNDFDDTVKEVKWYGVNWTTRIWLADLRKSFRRHSKQSSYFPGPLLAPNSLLFSSMFLLKLNRMLPLVVRHHPRKQHEQFVVEIPVPIVTSVFVLFWSWDIQTITRILKQQTSSESLSLFWGTSIQGNEDLSCWRYIHERYSHKWNSHDQKKKTFILND